MAQHNKKHGMYNTREYHTWEAIIQRCKNPNNPRYSDYGGRGITICERWKDFKNFFEDMGVAPAKSSIDRIDNNGPYSPENCRWANMQTQQRNLRSNVMIELNGETKCMAAWCEILSFPREKARWRLKNGWSPAEAFGLKFRPHRQKSIRDTSYK